MSDRFQQELSRRRFLTYSGGALAAVALPGMIGCQGEAANPPSAAASAKVFGETRVMPIGTQLYCVRKLLDENVPATIEALAGMGYEAVEFADYHGLDAAQWRKLLDDNGLQACGTHIYIETLEGDELQKTVDFNNTLGNRNLIVRSMKKESYETKDALLRTCERYNKIAESLRPHGMRTGFHNHAEIFDRFDGEYMWNIFADNTEPDVILQLDTGNASHVEGVDVIELLKRNAGRTVTTHVKPFSNAHPDAFLGADELDWSTIIPLYQTVAGTEFYIIEYEQEAFPPLEALKANLDILRGMLGRA
ncbi:MAG: TIM barrel protein [Rhodothermales bacterium]